MIKLFCSSQWKNHLSSRSRAASPGRSTPPIETEDVDGF